MRPLLLLAIELYWRLVPPRRRRHCLFRQSCSHYVYEVAAGSGGLAGLRALHRRFRQCRAPAGAFFGHGAGSLLLADGSAVQAEELSVAGQAALRQWLPHSPTDNFLVSTESWS